MEGSLSFIFLSPISLSTFNSLKSAFQTTPILIHHDPSKPIHLFTDASDFTKLTVMVCHTLWGFSHGSCMMQKLTMMSMIRRCWPSWNHSTSFDLGSLVLESLSLSSPTIKISNTP